MPSLHLVLVTSSIMSEINNLSSTPQNYRVPQHDDQESYEDKINEITRLRLYAEESRYELQELRHRCSDLEVQLRRSADELTNDREAVKTLIDHVSEALVAGRIGFSIMRGNSMTVTEDRLVCLGKESGRVFDRDSRSIEHIFSYVDVTSRVLMKDDVLIVEVQSRRDVLGFRLRVGKENSDKWQAALHKLSPALGSGMSNSESSVTKRSVDDSQSSRDKLPIRTNDASDEISVSGSLSSLASEVQKARLEKRRKEYVSSEQKPESRPIPSVYTFGGR